MPEELRGPIGVALYIALVTVVYWLVSDEIAGTLLLVFLALAAVVLVVLGWKLRRPAGPPLEIEEEPVVTTSAWPIVGALAAMLIGLGLLYGPWLWLPGAALALGAGYGWVTQTDA